MCRIRGRSTFTWGSVQSFSNTQNKGSASTGYDAFHVWSPNPRSPRPPHTGSPAARRALRGGGGGGVPGCIASSMLLPNICTAGRPYRISVHSQVTPNHTSAGFDFVSVCGGEHGGLLFLTHLKDFVKQCSVFVFISRKTTGQLRLSKSKESLLRTESEAERRRLLHISANISAIQALCR